MVMKSVVFVLSFLVASFGFSFALAADFKPSVFETQHVKDVELNEDVKWLFFAKTKKGSDVLQEAFADLGVDDAWLNKHHVLYVADIHRMPRIISEALALPKMRGYPYSVAIDRTGELTKDWKHKGSVITLYKLDNLKVKEVELFEDYESVIAFIKSYI